MDEPIPEDYDDGATKARRGDDQRWHSGAWSLFDTAFRLVDDFDEDPGLNRGLNTARFVNISRLAVTRLLLAMHCLCRCRLKRSGNSSLQGGKSIDSEDG